MSYIDGEARYLRALRGAAESASEAAANASRRFLCALRPGPSARVRARWGIDTIEEIVDRAVCARLAASSVPDAAALAALADIDAQWPRLPVSTASGLERLLDGWGLVWRDDEGLACNVELLVAMCRAHGIAGESLWLSGHLAEGSIAAARMVSSGAAQDVVCGVSTADLAEWLANGPRDASPQLLRAAAAEFVSRADPEPAAVDEAGALLRGVLFDVLSGGRPELAGYVGWLVDVPDAAPGLESTNPLLLAVGDEELPALLLGELRHLRGAEACLIAALAGGPDAEATTRQARIRALALLGAGDHGQLVAAAASGEPLSVGGLLARLQPANGGAANDVLVQRPAHGSVPWPLLLEASALPGLEAEVESLLGEAQQWDSFDAPGEGELPRFWMDALVVAGRWTAAWRGRFASSCPSVELPSDDARPGDVASRYRSPLAAAEQRLDPERSPMSAYSHGLHDGVGEAYGDVWSPGDPFSARRRK